MKKIEKFVFTPEDIKKLNIFTESLTDLCTGIKCGGILCSDCPLYPFVKQVELLSHDLNCFIMGQEIEYNNEDKS